MVELGYETIQFSPKFGCDFGLRRQVEAAKAAGFTWISLDRHALAEQERKPGGLAALRDICLANDLPCREIQSLRMVADREESLLAASALAQQVALFAPDVVPLIFFVPPTPAVLTTVRTAVDLLRHAHPRLNLAIEFSPLFPVPDVRAATDVIRDLALPDIGYVVDTWHVFNGSTTFEDLAGLDGQDVPLVQFNDHGSTQGADLTVEKDRRLLPGDGSFPLQRFVETMRSNGFDGLVGVEIVSAVWRQRTPEEFAERAYAAASRYWLPAG